MEESKNNKCGYHLAFPPIFLDNVYNNSRQGCLGILCNILVIIFVFQNLYDIELLSCDQRNIVEPRCDIGLVTSNNNVTHSQTTLIRQNGVNYEIAFVSWGDDTKYQITTILDIIFNCILFVGNSPYHNPIWLIIGFSGTSYTSYSYSTSINIVVVIVLHLIMNYLKFPKTVHNLLMMMHYVTLNQMIVIYVNNVNV